MNIKRMTAMFLLAALLLGGCAADTTDETFGTQVDKKQLVSDRYPEQNATVSLASD